MRFSLGPADRPQTVTWFEWLGIFVIIAEVIDTGFHWFALIWAPLMLWIIISISRRRSSGARLIFTSLYALGFIWDIYRLVMHQSELANGPVDWGLAAATMLQLLLVWSPATSRWLASRQQGEIELPA